jgi:AcrR family transcriptional regulator
VVDTTGSAPAVDGRATRWTGQQQRRRAEFVEAALTAIEEHGPDVSTEQIAAQAGVARTRLYRHFSGAQELNQAIAARAESMVLEGLAAAWDATSAPEQVIRTAVTTHLRWLTEHAQLYRYLIRHSVPTAAGDTVVNDVKKIISDLLSTLIGEWAAVLGIDTSIVAPLSAGLVGFVDAAAGRWVDEPGTISLDELVELLADWIWVVIEAAMRSQGVTIDPTTPLSEALTAAHAAGTS